MVTALKMVTAPPHAIPPTTGMFKVQAVAKPSKEPPNQRKSKTSAILYSEMAEIKPKNAKKNEMKIIISTSVVKGI